MAITAIHASRVVKASRQCEGDVWKHECVKGWTFGREISQMFTVHSVCSRMYSKVRVPPTHLANTPSIRCSVFVRSVGPPLHELRKLGVLLRNVGAVQTFEHIRKQTGRNVQWKLRIFRHVRERCRTTFTYIACWNATFVTYQKLNNWISTIFPSPSTSHKLIMHKSQFIKLDDYTPGRAQSTVPIESAVALHLQRSKS